jgi:hypothetical protein
MTPSQSRKLPYPVLELTISSEWYSTRCNTHIHLLSLSAYPSKLPERIGMHNSAHAIGSAASSQPPSVFSEEVQRLPASSLASSVDGGNAPKDRNPFPSENEPPMLFEVKIDREPEKDAIDSSASISTPVPVVPRVLEELDFVEPVSELVFVSDQKDAAGSVEEPVSTLQTVRTPSDPLSTPDSKDKQTLGLSKAEPSPEIRAAPVNKVQPKSASLEIDTKNRSPNTDSKSNSKVPVEQSSIKPTQSIEGQPSLLGSEKSTKSGRNPPKPGPKKGIPR